MSYFTFILFLISEILSLVAAASSFLLCLTVSMIGLREPGGSKCSEIFERIELRMVEGIVSIGSSSLNHNLKPEWTAATPKVRFSKSTNLQEWSIISLISFIARSFLCRIKIGKGPESGIFDHLSKLFLWRKLPDTFHQVLIRIPVSSQHLKNFISTLDQNNSDEYFSPPYG